MNIRYVEIISSSCKTCSEVNATHNIKDNYAFIAMQK